MTSKAVSYLSDKVAVQPRFMAVLPPSGAGHPLPGHIFREVRGVGGVLEQFAVAEAGAVDPGDGEVEVALPGEVTEEESGGQELRVGLAVVRVRDERVKHVADQVQHDREVWKPAEDDHEPVVAAVAAGAGKYLGLVLHSKTRLRGVSQPSGQCAECARAGRKGGAAAGKTRRGWRGRSGWEEGFRTRPMRHLRSAAHVWGSPLQSLYSRQDTS